MKLAKFILMKFGTEEPYNIFIVYRFTWLWAWKKCNFLMFGYNNILYWDLSSG